jgi:hypothetical protein
MLRYFRIIRKKLIEQDKVRKYLLYAIGEILLVVIGILIALQINNWNEMQKQKEISKETIQNLKIELLNTKERLVSTANFNNNILDASEKFISDEFSIDELKANPGDVFRFTDYTAFTIDLPILDRELSSERKIVGEPELIIQVRMIKDDAGRLANQLFYLVEFWNAQISPYLIQTNTAVMYHKHFKSPDEVIPYLNIQELAEGEEYKNIAAMSNLLTGWMNREAVRLISSIDEALLIIEEMN